MYQNSTVLKFSKTLGLAVAFLGLFAFQNCSVGFEVNKSSNFFESPYNELDISSHSTDAELNTYVEETFQKILDRTDDENAQDAPGIVFWMDRLRRGYTKAEFEAALYASTEYKIRQLYREELHRRADFEDLKYWIDAVDSGRTSIEELRLYFRDICTKHTGGECPSNGAGSNPSTPSGPGTPNSPSTPTIPTTPTTPGTPSGPSTPSTPANPSTPSGPSTPTTPTTPSTPTTPTVPSDAELLNYVTSKYKSILDRTDAENAQDESGIAYWVGRLKAGFTNAQFEASLYASTEYKIRQLYLQELHRRADFDGLKYWMNDVDSGKVTIEALRLHFRDICTKHTGGACAGIGQPAPSNPTTPGTPAGPGTPSTPTVPTIPSTPSTPTTPTTPAVPSDAELLNYVTSKYKSILDRTADENAEDTAGIAYWVGRLKAGFTKVQFEASLYASTEYKIRQLYLQEFNRRADFNGLKYWMNEVDIGRTTIEALRLHFRDICTKHTGGACAS